MTATTTETSAASAELPRWDLATVYPSVDDPSYAADIERLFEDIAGLAGRFDALGVDARAPRPLDEADIAAFEEITGLLNDILERNATIGAFLYGTVSADTRDERGQARLSEFEERSVVLSELTPRLTAWLGSLDGAALVERSDVARKHAYLIEIARREREHLLSPAEEQLLAQLAPSGPGGWEKLHQDDTAQIMVTLATREGEPPRELPMTEVRNLAFDADREVRRRAYEAELTAWEANALPLAAALNGIKGHVAVVSKRRGWPSPLAEALHHNRIDQASLDALMSAAEAAFPVFRRYLGAKARLLGLDKLAWYDLSAPVGVASADAASERWDFPNAMAFVIEQFGGYSPRLREMAERSLRERWIDAGPRPGKVGGAYCMPLRGDESRILANHQAAYSGASTLAHELGHAYHNLNQGHLTALLRGSPMTLAETASTFCETVVRTAAMRDASPADQLVILESYLQDASRVVLDICSRFRFESRVFAARAERQLSITELNDLMTEAQRETYGDAIADDLRHPYMWAVKSHYYSTASFYNYPYLFGLLFGVGLYARFVEEPDAFRANYDALLANTGQADAADLAAEFGVDIRTTGFWERSLATLAADVERFERLATTG